MVRFYLLAVRMVAGKILMAVATLTLTAYSWCCAADAYSFNNHLTNLTTTLATFLDFFAPSLLSAAPLPVLKFPKQYTRNPKPYSLNPKP